MRPAEGDALPLRRRSLLTAALFGGLAGCAAPRPPSAPGGGADSARIESLLARMTLDEKAGQLSLFAAVTADPQGNPQTHLQSANQQLAEVREGRVMGLFNGDDVAFRRRAQEVAVHESRLGIPLLLAGDVIHGLRTVFPVPLAEAATWEPALAERTARAAAEEATAVGLRWTFAPMVDIARDARWGRTLEGAGEDVLLGQLFAAARVRGFQGRDLADATSMLATPKHFAGYGAAEGGLDYNSVELSERTLREVYLPPFRSAVDAGALAVMSAFHAMNGVPSTANAALLRGVLRGEWGFRGFVVSDYTADEELIAHGVAADGRAAAKLAFLAGVDVSMQSGLYLQHLPALVAAGEVPLARLDDAVRRVLQVKQALGLFDAPLRGLDPTPDGRPVAMPGLAQHEALAREVAARAVVLLKNEGELLPLPRSGKRLALIGPFAAAPCEDVPVPGVPRCSAFERPLANGTDVAQDALGRWTVMDDATAPVALDQGLRAALADPALLTVVAGCDIDAPLPGGIALAVQVARAADVVLLAVGEGERMVGESRSRARIELPPAQLALAEAVAATGKPVVVLLRNGRALALTGAVRDAQAILVTWFLGQQAGAAVADVLFGSVAPSGRLPVSFPRASGQEPLYYAHAPTGRPVADGAERGDFKTNYVDMPRTPLYAFGHGLTYGRVRYETLTVDQSRLPWTGRLTVQAQVANIGTRDADEVVQLYVHERVAQTTRPVRELKTFLRVRLAPGATVTVTFTLTRDDLRHLGPDLRSTVEPGSFDLHVGPSAQEGLQTRFELLPP